MRKAFTMMELIFVIVVIGILAAVVIPRTGSNKLREAAIQVVSHIRYTQHLAMVDDKFDANNPQWFLGRWQITFSAANTTQSYRIFSEGIGRYNGNPDSNIAYTNSEVAANPQNRNNFLIGTADSNFANDDDSRLTPELDIGSKYGISSVKITGGSTGSSVNRILFDNLGRPYRGTTDTSSGSVIVNAHNRIAISPIFIKLCNNACSGADNVSSNDSEVVIRIENETGYACILAKNSSTQCF